MKKVADYADAEKKMLARRMGGMTMGTLLIFGFYLVLNYTGLVTGNSLQNLSDFALGLTAATLVLNIHCCMGLLDKIRAVKLAYMARKKNKQ